MDLKAGIKTSDELYALQLIIEELRVQIAERLDEILPKPKGKSKGKSKGKPKGA